MPPKRTQRIRPGGRLPLGLVLLAAVAATSGCPWDVFGPYRPGVGGRLNAGDFAWVCLDDTDSACPSELFPSQIAVGARFDLEFTPHDDTPASGPFVYVPANPDRLERSGPQGQESFIVVAAGELDVVVVADGYGVDLVSLLARPINSLRLDALDDPAEPFAPGVDCTPQICGEIPPGVAVDAWIPRGEVIRYESVIGYEGRPLAGVVPREWEVGDPEALSLDNRQGAQADLLGHRIGVTSLRIGAGSFERMAYVGVYEPPASTGGTGSSSSETSDGFGTTGGESTGVGTTGIGTGGSTEGGSR